MRIRQLRGWLVRLMGLFGREARDRELAEELESHLQMQIEDNIRGGMAPQEARRRALIKLGGVEPTKERYRRQRGIPMIETFVQDLRYGARMLRKNPGFTLVAVVTLALGIGANTAIFSVVNAVLLNPLPFRDSGQVVLVWNRGAEAAGGDRTPLAVADLLDWRAQSNSFDGIAAFRNINFNFTGGETPERVRAAGVTANFFEVLGTQAALGRTFLPEEEQPGAEGVVLLSDAFWRKRFGADPQVLGRALSLSGTSYTVVGVMPAALNFPAREVEMWAAMPLTTPTRRGPYFLTGVARLKAGVTAQQARAEAGEIKSSFDGGAFDFNVLPVNEYVVGDVRPALAALLVAVTLVLLIAAVNVANLTLVRASARGKEISIRTALGAGRWRIVRQLLTESLLLALMGGALGAVLATWGVDVLTKLAPGDIPRLEQTRIDSRVLGWTALVSLLTGVAFGLAPAWQNSRLNLNESLKEGGRSATEGAGRRRWRSVLVVAELALAVMLLVGAGLLVKSLWRLEQVETGVKAQDVLTIRLALPGQRYTQPQQVRDFYARLLERVQGLPGVRAAALSNSLPPDSTEFSDGFAIEGRPAAASQTPPIAYVIRVSPDYFRALGIPLRVGRYFGAADTAEAPRVMLINETFQRRFFPAENPLGKRINTGTDEEPVWNEVVGVVGDVKYNGLAEETQPAFYQTTAQAQSWGMSLIFKTEGVDPLGLIPAVRGEVRALDPELPLSQISTLEQRMAAATAQPRFRTTLIALFAALALVLACVGIYGVISYSVAQRTHEIGIRVALGAQARDVLKLVMRQGLVLALAGTAVGVLASMALTQLMKRLLFGVSATDPLTFVAVSLLLTAVALLACWIPARRATKVNPTVALRYE